MTVTAQGNNSSLSGLSPSQQADLLKMAVPRMVPEYAVHVPHPKQQLFLLTNKKEVMFGGAAGGGKSDALLMSALQYVDVPGYSALILRRTWPDLNAPGAILDRARTWLTPTNARQREGGRIWEFPSGARIQFGYLLREDDKYKYQSSEYQFVGFDELTHFDESQYTYLFSRIRRPQLVCLSCSTAVIRDRGKWRHANRTTGCTNLFPDPLVLEQYPASEMDGKTRIFDVPLRMRSASNPGGRGHQWARDRFINPETKPKSTLFIPSRLTDNPSLDRESYEEELSHMSALDRQRLLNGDWDVLDEGDMFERHWFRVISSAPTTKRKVVRYWDKAATENGGDWTVGAKLSLIDGQWVIEDVVRGQWSSLQVERVIASTAAADGREVPIRMEQEPGSSGKDIISHYKRNVLVGYNFDGDRPTGDKTVRAAPMASALESGNMFLVEGRWNKDLIDEFTTFPSGAHDDIVDSCSGAFNHLAFARRGRLLV